MMPRFGGWVCRNTFSSATEMMSTPSLMSAKYSSTLSMSCIAHTARVTVESSLGDTDGVHYFYHGDGRHFTGKILHFASHGSSN